MDKLLIVCGPTATGKTRLAMGLANAFNGEIISADSRQVYKHMDIVTGKDLPVNFKIETSNLKAGNIDINYYTNGEIRIWGYDLVNPDEEFSAKLFSDFAKMVLQDIYYRRKLPIIEGGTGFYIDALLKDFEKIDIPVNRRIRAKYEHADAGDLFKKLMIADPKRALSMNESDRKNPRRLIRALEVADFEKSASDAREKSDPENYDIYWIGLTYLNREKLFKKIDERVDARVGGEMEKEIGNLKKLGFLDSAPLKTPGYKHWKQYIDGEITKDEAIQKWKNAEHDYARRQLTWFKRNLAINWFAADSDNLAKKVEAKVSKWYDAK